MESHTSRHSKDNLRYLKVWSALQDHLVTAYWEIEAKSGFATAKMGVCYRSGIDSQHCRATRTHNCVLDQTGEPTFELPIIIASIALNRTKDSYHKHSKCNPRHIPLSSLIVHKEGIKQNLITLWSEPLLWWALYSGLTLLVIIPFSKHQTWKPLSYSSTATSVRFCATHDLQTIRFLRLQAGRWLYISKVGDVWAGAESFLECQISYQHCNTWDISPKTHTVLRQHEACYTSGICISPEGRCLLKRACIEGGEPGPID